MSKTVTGNATSSLDLLWNPHQQAFLKALDEKTPSGMHAYHRLSLFAGRRGGKTKIGAVGVGKKMRVPKSIGWVCAPTYPDLHDFVIPEVFRVIPHAWIGNWSEQHYELELKNYAKCQFRSLEDPDKARGPGLDWAWIDETRKVAEKAWFTMLPALTDKGGQAWFTTSPNQFDWCYETFWRPAKLGVPGYWAVKYRTAENPIYKTAAGRAELADAKRAMDPLFYQQEFEAEFVTFTGAVYGSALEGQILRTADQIREVIPEWPRIEASRICYVGMDPGSDHPFSVVVAVAVPRGLVIIGEYERRNRPVAEHVQDIRGLLMRDNPAHPFQPTTWAIDKSQKMFAIEMAQAPHHIYCTAAENDVENGIRRVQAWLSTKQLFFIEERCPRTIEQLRGYRWAENTTPDGQAKREKVIKRKDDLPDAVRYLIMAGPELPDAPSAGNGGRRDLSQMPEHERWALERMQRIELADQEQIEFFASERGEDAGMLAYDREPEGFAGDFWQ